MDIFEIDSKPTVQTIRRRSLSRPGFIPVVKPAKKLY
jgi:hypothetical protein